MAQQGGELFLEKYQWIGFKLETDRGVTESLSNSDYNVLAEISSVEVDVKENVRKYAVGDTDPEESVMGAKMIKFAMKIHMKGSGANGAPVFYGPLQTAGFQLSTVSDVYSLDKLLPGKTATMSFVGREDAAATPSGKRYIAKGCGMDKCAIHVDSSGSLMYIDASFVGACVTVEDFANAGLPVADTTTETTLPPAAISMEAYYGEVPLPVAAMVIDFQNKGQLIEYVQDPSGYSFYQIGEQDIMINIAPLIQFESTMPVQADLLSSTHTIREFFVSIGTGTYNQIQITAYRAQIVKGLKWGGRNGIAADTMVLRVLQNRAGDPATPLRITQPGD